MNSNPFLFFFYFSLTKARGGGAVQVLRNESLEHIPFFFFPPLTKARGGGCCSSFLKRCVFVPSNRSVSTATFQPQRFNRNASTASSLTLQTRLSTILPASKSPPPSRHHHQAPIPIPIPARLQHKDKEAGRQRGARSIPPFRPAKPWARGAGETRPGQASIRQSVRAVSAAGPSLAGRHIQAGAARLVSPRLDCLSRRPTKRACGWKSGRTVAVPCDAYGRAAVQPRATDAGAPSESIGGRVSGFPARGDRAACGCRELSCPRPALLIAGRTRDPRGTVLPRRPTREGRLLRVATAGTSRWETSRSRKDPGKAVRPDSLKREIRKWWRFQSFSCRNRKSCDAVEKARRSTTKRWRRTLRTESPPRDSAIVRVHTSDTYGTIGYRSDRSLGKDRRPRARDGRNRRACTGASGFVSPDSSLDEHPRRSPRA